MKSISIYAITRKQNLAQLSRMERQLSKREKPLKMREWELDSLKNLVEQLEKRMPADLYDRGIAVPAGTPLREIYEERCVLYARYADLIVASQDGEADTARLVEDVMRTVGLET